MDLFKKIIYIFSDHSGIFDCIALNVCSRIDKCLHKLVDTSDMDKIIFRQIYAAVLAAVRPVSEPNAFALISEAPAVKENV